MADTKDVIVTGTEVTPAPLVDVEPLDQTIEGGKYLNEQGKLVNANGELIDNKGKVKGKSLDDGSRGAM